MKEIRTVTAKWVRKHFKEVIDRVNAGEHFMVEDDNTSTVVILSRSEYEHLKRQADLSRFFTSNNNQESELVTESSRITEADRQAELRIIKQQVYGK